MPEPTTTKVTSKPNQQQPKKKPVATGPVKQNSKEETILETTKDITQAKLSVSETASPTDPVAQIQLQVLRKIRNLDKRKMKLEVLKAEEKSGKKLKAVQKEALSKLDDVVENIEYFKDFSKQVDKIVEDTLKEKKKQEKEDQIKRQKEEQSRIKALLIIQDVLSNIGDDETKEVLKTGLIGKLKPLKEEKIKGIDQFYELVFPDRKRTDQSFDEQLNVAADKLFWLLEGKKKEAVKGMGFSEMRDTLLSIHKSGLLGETGAAASPTDMLTTPQPQTNGTISPLEHNETSDNPMEQQQAAQVGHIVHTNQSQYSFGTVGGTVVETRPDQDPAVVSIIGSFPGNSIPSQIYTNASFHHHPPGVFVPVSVPHMLPNGQFVPFQQHIEQRQGNAEMTEQLNVNNNLEVTGDSLNNNLQNLKLTEGQTQSHGDNEFRVKDHKRNKFNQGNRRDNDRPPREFERHGSSNGFQRKTDRYQGNQRDRPSGDGKKPYRGPGGGTGGGYQGRPGGPRGGGQHNGQSRNSGGGGGNYAPRQQQAATGQQAQQWS